MQGRHLVAKKEDENEKGGESEEPSEDAKEKTRWYYEDNKHKFLPYSDGDSTALEAAYRRSDSTVKFSVGKKRYTIDLKAMRQENEKTRKKRAVKRVGASEGNSWMRWKGRGEKGRFVPFDKPDIEIIEKAHQNGEKTVEFQHGRRRLRVDFARLVLINLRNQKEVPIRSSLAANSLAAEAGNEDNKNEEMKTGKRTAPEKVDPDSDVCKICFAGRQDVVFVPCGHLGCCAKCSAGLAGHCPFCNAAYTQIIQVYQQ